MENKGLSFFKRLKPLVFPTIYFVLVITLSISLFSAFKKRNYLSIYIDGPSMQPTLNNNVQREDVRDPNTGLIVKQLLKNTEFGYADTSKIAKENIKHFDIVVTYYASDYNADKELNKNADYKIKRIIALPNETFKIEQGIISYKNADGTWDTPQIPFTPNGSHKTDDTITYPHSKDIGETTLKDDEYWVLGDNWLNSSDSKVNGPVLTSYIAGVLVAIEGTCTLVTFNGKDSFKDYQYYKKPVYYL